MSYVEGLLGKNEQIIISTRHHWTVLARSFLTNFAFVIAIVVAAIMLAMATGLAALLLLLLVALPMGLLARDYLTWENEEYLVTNRRVIQTAGIFNKHVIDSSLEKVNDVILRQSYLGRMLDYGDIEILTASEIGVNRLWHIAGPIQFKTEMLNQKEAMAQEDHLAAPIGDRPEDIPALIAALDELRQRGVLTDAEFQEKKTELLAKM